MVVDAAGDAYVAGELDLYFSVVKFSGADGSETWRAEIDGTNTTFRIPQLAQSLALDASGNVIAAGHVNNAGTARDFAVVKLDAATGAELWRLTLDGGDGSPDIAYDVAVDASNDVIAAGKLELLGSDDDFTVVKIDGATGVVDGATSVVDGATSVVDGATRVVVVAASVEDVTGSSSTPIVGSQSAAASSSRSESRGSPTAPPRWRCRGRTPSPTEGPCTPSSTRGPPARDEYRKRRRIRKRTRTRKRLDSVPPPNHAPVSRRRRARSRF